MTLAERKLQELTEKLDSLPWEFRQWQSESERRKPLEKHYTQIRAVTKALEALISSIRDKLEPPAGVARGILSDVESLELMILEVHRIWQFFRAKLALRYVSWFRPYLLAADDFAWNCYEPAQRWIDGGVGREPPLVSFSGGSSPFVMPRGSAYFAEDVPEEALRTEQFRQALQRLPIPVVGVPWFQVHHLPDAPLIGHEIGHNVEEDLRLGPRLRSILEALAVDQSRRPAWRAWLGEIFADVYGTLTTGPAFVSALMDFLAADFRTVAGEWRGEGMWGSYPTRTLRVMLSLATLESNSFERTAGELRERWVAAYPTHQMGSFEPEVEDVVHALIRGPYPELGGGSLKDVMSFSEEQHALALRSASEVVRGRKPPADDVRCLIAAGRLAYDQEPVAYFQQKAADRILRKVEAVQTIGTRAGRGPGPDEALRDARDVATGQALFDFIALAHAGNRQSRQGGGHV